MGTAEIKGAQRKVMSHAIRPLKPSHGSRGIAVRSGRTLPFVVEEEWSAPAGNYAERFYIVDIKTREIIFEGPETLQLMWGLQGLTTVRNEIDESFGLTPGTYLLVFALGGLAGGEFEFEAIEAPSEAAA